MKLAEGVQPDYFEEIHQNYATTPFLSVVESLTMHLSRIQVKTLLICSSINTDSLFFSLYYSNYLSYAKSPLGLPSYFKPTRDIASWPQPLCWTQRVGT